MVDYRPSLPITHRIASRSNLTSPLSPLCTPATKARVTCKPVDKRTLASEMEVKLVVPAGKVLKD